VAARCENISGGLLVQIFRRRRHPNFSGGGVARLAWSTNSKLISDVQWTRTFYSQLTDYVYDSLTWWSIVELLTMTAITMVLPSSPRLPIMM
jgi:hypothetical protein